MTVRQSDLPGNSGRGLFARRNIKKGTIICDYKGKVVDSSAIFSGDYDSDYVIEVMDMDGNLFYIDAKESGNTLGKFMNDCLDEERVNAKIVCRLNTLRDDDTNLTTTTTTSATISLPVIAQDDIEEGDEIYVAYGRVYWLSRLHLLPQDLVDRVFEEHN